MPDFPFDPKPVGNFCYTCCEDCIKKVNDPEAQCCKSLSGNVKECYSPKKECKQCKSIPPENEGKKIVVSLCTDVNFAAMHEGKTSCCNGECYNNCYKCENNKLVPNYDEKNYGCCNGVPYPKKCKECCYECKKESQSFINKYGETVYWNKEKLIQNRCSNPEADGYDPNNPNCCYGDCWNESKEKCKECKQTNTNPDTGELKNKCPGSDLALSECCSGECYDPKNKCKECVPIDLANPFDKIYRDVPDCGECCKNPNTGESVCCQKQTCCASSGECYDKKCERCD